MVARSNTIIAAAANVAAAVVIIMAQAASVYVTATACHVHGENDVSLSFVDPRKPIRIPAI